jgi:hypothetical protein
MLGNFMHLSDEEQLAERAARQEFDNLDTVFSEGSRRRAVLDNFRELSMDYKLYSRAFRLAYC